MATLEERFAKFKSQQPTDIESRFATFKQAQVQPGVFTQVAPMEEQPGLTGGEVISQAISNIPASAAQFGKDILTPFMEPIQTAKSLTELGKGFFNKLTPGVQPSEQAVDALVDFFKDRYGGIENIKRTIATDPVGFASDLSILLTGGGSAVVKGAQLAGKGGKFAKAVTEVGKVLQKTGRVLEPINLAKAPIKAVAKLTPSAVSERLISSGVKFRQKGRESLRAFDARKQKIINTALDEKITPSASGLRKTKKLIKEYTDEVDNIIESGIKEGRGKKVTISTDDVLARMDDIRDRFEFSVVGDDFLDEMEKMKTSIKERFGDTLTPSQAQKIKRSTQKDLSRFFGQEVAVKKELAKQVTRGLREELEIAFPEIGNLNKKASALIALEDEFGKAVKNMNNRGMIGLTTKILSAGGTQANFMAALFNEIAGRPRVKAKLAIALNQARKTPFAKTGPTLLRQLAVQAGRQPELQEEETQQDLRPRLSEGLRRINGTVQGGGGF